jgi:hypothetical protein
MTDYAANYTARIRLQYQSLERLHKILWRVNSVSEGALVAGANELANFLNALSPFRFTDWSEVGWEWCEEGGTFFVPFIPGSVIDAGAATVSGSYDANAFMGFQGISSLGNRASLFLYGVKVVPQTGVSNTQDDYRIYGNENADVLAAISELNLAVINCAIDGTNVSWKNYANLGYNAYWQRKSR